MVWPKKVKIKKQTKKKNTTARKCPVDLSTEINETKSWAPQTSLDMLQLASAVVQWLLTETAISSVSSGRVSAECFSHHGERQGCAFCKGNNLFHSGLKGRQENHFGTYPKKDSLSGSPVWLRHSQGRALGSPR